MRDLSKAVNLIESFEGCELSPYKDSAGIPTIGIGTTVYPDGRKVSMSDSPITKDQAEKYLISHMLKDCDPIERVLKSNNLTIKDNQFCALLCFAYNLGVGPIVTPGKSLHDSLLTKDNGNISSAIKLYCRAAVNGKRSIVRGLVRRREAEALLYCS